MVTLNDNFLSLNVCESKQCEFSDVESVKTPEASDRWAPIAHDALVKEFRDAVDNNPALDIVQEHHALHRYGQRYFGLFQVSGAGRKHGNDVGTVMCLRNSHDKAFRAGISAGDAPFVCDNLIFTNTVKLARRHTKNIFAELDWVADTRLTSCVTYRRLFLVRLGS